MAEAVRLCREDMEKAAGPSSFGGRYGLNSLIFFHPSADLAALPALYENLAREIEKRLDLDVAVGIAPHPFLDFRKADALENCQKALEYGMLLPNPHVGVLDSLALNISADKRFSQGDIFGAIKEYQLALLADENNCKAWNSLGVFLAGLKRRAEAERHFSRALTCKPDDTMALYNLGYMHQSQGRAEEARDSYLECLRHEPDHLFAIVRLGQLAENAGRNDAAREYYEQAAILPGGEGLTCRHFARLCIGENKPDEAREHLHEALLHDPQDALALALLARLYLDAGEDPEMAATLARHSVSLLPGLKSGWLQLARALENAGRDREAREARLKAGEI
jgi:tetratricopeptide (TPR) repeat protein